MDKNQSIHVRKQEPPEETPRTVTKAHTDLRVIHVPIHGILDIIQCILEYSKSYYFRSRAK